MGSDLGFVTMKRLHPLDRGRNHCIVQPCDGTSGLGCGSSWTYISPMQNQATPRPEYRQAIWWFGSRVRLTAMRPVECQRGIVRYPRSEMYQPQSTPAGSPGIGESWCDRASQMRGFQAKIRRCVDQAKWADWLVCSGGIYPGVLWVLAGCSGSPFPESCNPKSSTWLTHRAEFRSA